MKKYCLNCGIEFKSTNKHRVFCSEDCGGKYRKKQDKIRAQEALERARAILS